MPRRDVFKLTKPPQEIHSRNVSASHGSFEVFHLWLGLWRCVVKCIINKKAENIPRQTKPRVHYLRIGVSGRVLVRTPAHAVAYSTHFPVTETSLQRDSTRAPPEAELPAGPRLPLLLPQPHLHVSSEDADKWAERKNTKWKAYLVRSVCWFMQHKGAAYTGTDDSSNSTILNAEAL